VDNSTCMEQLSGPSVVEAIGFEGELPEACSLTWGAVAIRTGETLVNSVTGRRAPITKLNSFVAGGVVYVLSTPIPLTDDALNRRLFAVVIRKTSQAYPVIECILRQYAYAVGQSDPPIYLIEDNDDEASSPLALMMRSACDAIAGIKGASPELVRSGLLLDAFHPELNAMRVVQAEPGLRAHVLSLACACFKGSSDVKRFTDTLKANGILLKSKPWDKDDISHYE
jgi:hypothetical protein